MIQHKFDADDWVERLATALEDVAPLTRAWGPIQSYIFSVPRHDQYSELVNLVRHNSDMQIAFEASHLSLDSDPTEAMEILREHPVLNQPEGIGIVIPKGSWSFVELKTLVLYLIKLAIKTDARTATCTLHRFLKMGEARQLEGHEITFFYGLNLDDRIDIGDGAFLAPYSYAKEIYSIPEHAEKHTIINGTENASSHSPRSISVLVRDLVWGPAVAPGDNYESTLKVKYQLSNHPDDYVIVIDLLSIVTHRPMRIQAQYISVAKWLEDINPNFRFGWFRRLSSSSDGRHARHSLSEEDTEVFREMICGWQNYQGKHDVIKLAIRRLASSISRINPFGIEDRILDTAIALEAMYNLQGSELTYKLSTRAAYFLGADAEKRTEIFNNVKSFYKARSSIAHGESKKKDPAVLNQAFNDGLDLARDTLFKLLRIGRQPNWDNLVITGSINVE